MKKNIGLLTALILVSSSMLNSQVTKISYTDGEQKLAGFSSKPKKTLNENAGILILPAWFGINDHFKKIAENLSDLGYQSFVADIYGEGNYPTDKKQAAEKSGYYKNHVTDYHRRIKLAMNELIKQGADPKNIVIIGYCFGGFGAIEAARNNFDVKGIVSFHGSYGRDTTQAIVPIFPKVLICHGALDPYTTEAQIKSFQKEMNTAKADWQMIYYANAVHSFTEPAAGNDNSKGAAYNAAADRRSWEAMKQFLNEVLK